MAMRRTATINDWLTREDWTVEEFVGFHAPGDPAGHRYGLIEGRIIRLGNTGHLHGLVTGKLFALLFVFVTAHKLGQVLPPDTLFNFDPQAKSKKRKDTGLSPDVSFIRAERITWGVTSGAVPVPPDLAVEVISPSQQSGKERAEIDLKVEKYIAAGVPLIWVIDPQRHSVEIFRGEFRPETRHANQELEGEMVVPGFKVKISELFDF